jgi:hypothetical protein
MKDKLIKFIVNNLWALFIIQNILFAILLGLFMNIYITLFSSLLIVLWMEKDIKKLQKEYQDKL